MHTTLQDSSGSHHRWHMGQQLQRLLLGWQRAQGVVRVEQQSDYMKLFVLAAVSIGYRSFRCYFHVDDYYSSLAGCR